MKILRPILCAFALLAQLSSNTSFLAAQSSLRIPRVVLQSDHFKGFAPGYAERWLRNMRIPSFCRMNLCHGTCADPSRSIYDPSLLGIPSFYNPMHEFSAAESDTPCALRTFHNLLWTIEPYACQHGR
jgi:hypothetical protein